MKNLSHFSVSADLWIKNANPFSEYITVKYCRNLLLYHTNLQISTVFFNGLKSTLWWKFHSLMGMRSEKQKYLEK